MKTFHTVQVLRGVAALLVLMVHATMVLPLWGRIFSAGGAGVDIFFTISGFVMVVTTAPIWGRAKTWAPFIWRRITRIMPLYWILTILGLAWPLYFAPPTTRPSYVVASFLLIPAWDDHHSWQPIIPQGWTLIYEMFFYLLFAGALALRLRPVGWVSALLVAGTLVGMYWPPDLGAATVLLSPMLLEFALGMMVGAATLARIRLPAPAALPAILFMLIMLAVVDPQRITAGQRVLLFGLPAALLLAAGVGIEERWGARLAGLGRLLGDTSYALYLSHFFSLAVVAKLMIGLPLGGPFAIGAQLIAGLGFPFLIGVTIHRWIEKPLLGRLQSMTPGFCRLSTEPFVLPNGFPFRRSIGTDWQ